MPTSDSKRESQKTIVETPRGFKKGILQFPYVVTKPFRSLKVGNYLADCETLSRNSGGDRQVVMVTAYADTQNPIVEPGTAPSVELKKKEITASAQIIIDRKAFVADMATATLVEEWGRYLHVKKHYFARFKYQTQEVMGCHFYVTYFSGESAEVSIKIHNGVLNKDTKEFNGAVFYDELSININGQEKVLAESLGQNQKHLFRPQEQINHFARVVGPTAIPVFNVRCIGENSLRKHGMGAEFEGIGTVSESFEYAGLAGEAAMDKKMTVLADRMANALNTGLADESVDLLSDRMGPFMPLYLGDSGAGAPGGWGIYPTRAYVQSQSQIKLLKMQHVANMDRNPRVVVNTNGKRLTAKDFLDENGKLPFYFNAIGGWSLEAGYLQQRDTLPWFTPNKGKGYNSGSFCPYLGSKYSGGMASYEGYDDAHYCRQINIAKPLYYFTGNWLVRDDLISMAEWVHFTWGDHLVSANYWDEQGHTVAQLLTRETPHVTCHLERSFGWTCDSMAQAYAVASPEWRDTFRPWFNRVAELVDRSTLPSGLVQRESQGSHLHLTATEVGFPQDQDVAGAIYLGICGQGFYAISKAVFNNTNRPLAKQIVTAMDSVFQVGPYLPEGIAQFMSVAPKDGQPYQLPQHFAGTPEHFNQWWPLVAAFRLTNNIKYLEHLKKYWFQKPTHQAKRNEIYLKGMTWDDKILNAQAYLAIAEDL